MSDSNSASPLSPCPFCGCSRIGMANEKHDHSGGYYIGCPDCGASTELCFACGDDPRPLLAEKWNRRAALPSVLPGSWQPIETAPKDGTPMLCFWETTPESVCARNYAITFYERGGWWDAEHLTEEYGKPDYWMPLPTPPGAAPVLPGEREKQDAVDAERYRWLRDTCGTQQEGDHMNPPLAQISFTKLSPGVIGEGPSLDAAIDDARAAKDKP